tara:strand:- start:1028 stop:1216 length:189 start_codon:yes stop_codon:yes gene_type:complete
MNLVAIVLLSGSLYAEQVDTLQVDEYIVASSEVKKKKKKGKKVSQKGKKKKKGFFSKVFGAK